MIAGNHVDLYALMKQWLKGLCQFKMGLLLAIERQVTGQKQEIWMDALCLGDHRIEQNIRPVRHFTVSLCNGTEKKIGTLIQGRRKVMQIGYDHDRGFC